VGHTVIPEYPFVALHLSGHMIPTESPAQTDSKSVGIAVSARMLDPSRPLLPLLLNAFPPTAS
jgi:hypothetical protein